MHLTSKTVKLIHFIYFLFEGLIIVGTGSGLADTVYDLVIEGFIGLAGSEIWLICTHNGMLEIDVLAKAGKWYV